MNSDGPPSAFHPVVSRRHQDVSSPERGGGPGPVGGGNSEIRAGVEEGPPGGVSTGSSHHVMPLNHSGIPVSPMTMTNPLIPGMFDRRLLRVSGK